MFLDKTPPPSEINFNKRHSTARRVIENAFGRLKCRWRRLLKDPLEYELSEIPKLISVCCILHNFCAKENDSFVDGWWDQTSQSHAAGIPTQAPVIQSSASMIRDALAHHF